MLMVTQLESKGILSTTQDSIWQKDFFFPAAGKDGGPKFQINIFLARWSLLLSLHFFPPPKEKELSLHQLWYKSRCSQEGSD